MGKYLVLIFLIVVVAPALLKGFIAYMYHSQVFDESAEASPGAGYD